MSGVAQRLAEVETSLSIQTSLLSAALNPQVAGQIKDRIAVLQAQRTDLLVRLEAER